MRPAKPKPQSTKLPNHDRNYKIPKNFTYAASGKRKPKIGTLVVLDEIAPFGEEEYQHAKKVFEDRSIKLNLPSIQLERHDTKGVSEAVAEVVITRANGQCEMCDRYPDTGVPMQISHTVAKGMGGTHGERAAYINSPENLRYLCELCHLKLFHGQSVRYNPGRENEISCETCWLFTVCHATAVERGILEE
mgnify:CR=1 FL=1